MFVWVEVEPSVTWLPALPYLEGSAFHFRFNTWAWELGFLHAELPRRWGRLLSRDFHLAGVGVAGGKGEGRRVTAGS